MSLSTGRLRCFVSIRKKTGTSNAFNEENVTYTEYVKRHCEIMPLSGDEQNKAEGQNTKVKVEITFRHEPGLIRNDDIIVDLTTSPQQVYEITSPPVNVRNERRELKITAELRNVR